MVAYCVTKCFQFETPSYLIFTIESDIIHYSKFRKYRFHRNNHWFSTEWYLDTNSCVIIVFPINLTIFDSIPMCGRNEPATFGPESMANFFTYAKKLSCLKKFMSSLKRKTQVSTHRGMSSIVNAFDSQNVHIFDISIVRYLFDTFIYSDKSRKF